MLRFFLGLLLLLPSLALAQTESEFVKTEYANSVLLAERGGIAPGETMYLGFHQELNEGWHVYWQNPGDSGLPLTLNWQLPEGWSAGEIQYPVPHQLSVPPLMNYGHEGKPTFLVPITAPATAKPGDIANLSVKAGWLICEEICVPENADLEIAIPITKTYAAPDTFGAVIIADAVAALPVAAPFAAVAFDQNGAPAVQLKLQDRPLGTAHYFPYAEGLIEPAGRVLETVDAEQGMALLFTAGFDYDPASFSGLDGVVTFTKEGEKEPHQVFIVTAPLGEATLSVVTPEGESAAETSKIGSANTSASVDLPSQEPQPLFVILGLALLGGLILNVMPCVFPVIFLKAGALAQSAQHDMGTVRRHGLLYTAGVVLAFLAIAGALIALRSFGEAQLGWGFQLQHPVPIAIFAIIMMLIGLNLSGVFEMGTSVQGVGDGLASKGGNAGAFFTGLLAVAVAAPCVGPFLGGALSYALNAPGVLGLAVFAVMGLGLALPYLIISFVPAIAKALPRPGAWMETFKQFLAFPMFATAIWLIWTLTNMAGSTGLVILLCAMLVVAFGAWIYGRGQAKGGIVSKLVALAALVVAGFMIKDITIQQAGPVAVNAPGGDTSKLPSDVFSPERLAELRANGTPVFIDFTASWCVTCQTNKLTAIKRPAVIEAFHETGTVYMVADWTVQDPVITETLAQYGRSGVPLYLYYQAGAEEAEILPQILTTDIMLKTIRS